MRADGPAPLPTAPLAPHGWSAAGDPAEGSAPWWSLHSHGRDRHPVGSRYRYDNRNRGGRDGPSGLWVVQVVEAGGFDFRDETGVVTPVSTGDVVVFCYGEDTRYGHAEPLASVLASRWVTLMGAGLADHLRHLRSVRGPVLRPAPMPGVEGGRHPMHDAMDGLIEQADPTRPVTATDAAEATHRFVATLARWATDGHDMRQRPIDRAIASLTARPFVPWSLQEVADRHGVSREHLARQFRAAVGEPPLRYLNRRRAERALRLMSTTGLPPAEVARQCGFASVTAMRRHTRDAGRG